MKLFIETANGYIHATTETDFLGSYSDFSDMSIVDAGSVGLVGPETVTYKEDGAIKVKWKHTDNKFYLLKTVPDWPFKYVDGEILTTYADFSNNLETEIA